MMLSGLLTFLGSIAIVLADLGDLNPPYGTCLCIDGTDVSVRDAPGLDSNVIGLANTGECYKYTGSRLTTDGYRWYRVDYNGREGWIAGNYMNVGDASQCGDGGGGSGEHTCHGDIKKLNPKGASYATAGQDGLDYNGVPASQTMLGNDKSEIDKRKSCYEQVGAKHCLSPSLIAALASRESRAGRLLYNTDGWGDCGSGTCRAYGILQCDIHSSGLGSRCTAYHWGSCEHMDMMIENVFLDKVRCVQNKKPEWTKEQQLQGGVAAYNFGCSNVQTWENLDQGTTGNDYSNDVMARAQHLQGNYGWD